MQLCSLRLRSNECFDWPTLYQVSQGAFQHNASQFSDCEAWWIHHPGLVNKRNSFGFCLWAVSISTLLNIETFYDHFSLHFCVSFWCDYLITLTNLHISLKHVMRFLRKTLGISLSNFFPNKIGKKRGKRTGLLIKKTLIRLRKNHVLSAGWEVRMVKNCDLGHSFSPYGPTLSRQITFFFLTSRNSLRNKLNDLRL